MPVLFRAKKSLTLHQLAQAWSRELAGPEKNSNQIERDLAHLLLEDVINGRFDDVGPVFDCQRLGLRIVTPDNRAAFLEGREILETLQSGVTAEFLSHRIIVMKEAALAFAENHKLPAPSWWQNTAFQLSIVAPDTVTEAGAPSLKSNVDHANFSPSTKQGRRPLKLEGVKQEMREDLSQKRLTIPALKDMTQEKLAKKYGVARETAQKARKEVLSGIVDP